MSITIQLDTPALQKLIELGGPEFVASMRQAAVAEVTRRAFAKYLPDEVKRSIDENIRLVRKELQEVIRDEKLLDSIIRERVDAAKRGAHVSSFIPDPIRQRAREMVDEMIEMDVRKIVLEKLESPDGIQQLVDKRVETMVERITKRFEGEALDRIVDAEIRKRVDAMVQERVAAVIAGLGQAA